MELRRIIVKNKSKGYGMLFMEWAKEFTFKQKNMQRLWLDVFTENKRAYTLYRKSGFIQEGIKRNTVLENSKYKSQYILSMLKSEYEKSEEHKNEKSKVRRVPSRGIYDREEIYKILDKFHMCHVGFVYNDYPVIIPTLYGEKIMYFIFMDQSKVA